MPWVFEIESTGAPGLKVSAAKSNTDRLTRKIIMLGNYQIISNIFSLQQQNISHIGSHMKRKKEAYLAKMCQKFSKFYWLRKCKETTLFFEKLGHLMICMLLMSYGNKNDWRVFRWNLLQKCLTTRLKKSLVRVAKMVYKCGYLVSSDWMRKCQG